MDIIGIIIANNTVLAGIILLILGLWTYFERRDRPVHQTFAALLIASALWLFTFVLWNGAADVRQELFWLKTLFSIGSLLPVLFLLFILAFIGRFPRTAVQALILSPCAALFGVAFGTRLLVTAIAAVPHYAIGGIGKALFAWHFALTLVAALLVVLYEKRVNPAFDKAKIAPLVVGAITAFQIIFVLLFVARIGEGSVTRQWIGSLAVIALLAGMLAMSFVIDPKKFTEDLRPVGGELFILIVIFLVSMDIAVAESPIGLSVRMVILILLVIYGVSAVRTATREVQRLREIGALHDQLVKVNGRLIEADKLKTRFVSFASHQLRAPIGGIRSYLELLRQGDLDPVTDRQKHVLGTAADAVGRLAETVETFLDVAKIELGAQELFRTETNVAKLIGTVVEDLRAAAGRKRIDIVIATPVGLPSVLCDAGKLYHAIANLVQNAIKYTETGGITISAASDGRHLTVRVADSGIGLSEAEKAKVVELLRGGLLSVHFDASGGSGLGLFIVKSIIDAHGGEIIVESAGRGHGSTFGFRIPLT